MKKRRKVLSVMLCAAMIASLAACGSKGDDKKSSDDGGKVKLTFSTSVYVEEPHQKAIDALLEAYSKKEPNVEIEILGAGYDGYWDNITTEILSNNESDMIQVYPENISTYNAIRDGGTFMDLSEYMSDDLKEKLVGVDRVPGAILADLHFNRFHAVWTEKRFFSAIPLNSGIAHIAVSCPLLGKDRVHALVALLIKGIKPIQLCDAVHHHGIGVRQRFPDLTHPFSCDMRWAHNDAEGLSSAVFFLCCP